MIGGLSRAEIDELLREQVVGRIGCGGLAYVVPVIYAYDGDGLYVASIEGQKARMIVRTRASASRSTSTTAPAAGGARSSKVPTRSSTARTLRPRSRSSQNASD